MRELIVFHNDDTDDFDEWRDALARDLPEVPLVRPADADVSEAVRYALTWQPPQGFFAGYPNLALVLNLGAGVDRLLARDDLPDLPICRLTDPTMARTMTAYVLFAVLRYARDIPVFERAKRAGRWTYVYPTLPGKIGVGILGLGELGRTVAQECARLGFAVRGWSRSLKSLDGVECHAGPEALPDFLAKTDILVCLLPGTRDTIGLLDEKMLRCLPRGSSFINVGRGSTVDEPALIELLESGHIAGATLDVFAVEPLPESSPLWTMDNVLITPHLAAVSSPETASVQVADNIRRFREGRELINLVDPGAGY